MIVPTELRRGLDQRAAVRSMAGLDRARLGGIDQPFMGVLTDRLQHPEAGRICRMFWNQHGPVHQASQRVHDRCPGIFRVRRLVATHVLSRLEGATVHKGAEPGEQNPFLGVQQVVAPVDGRPDRPVPVRRGP